MIASLIPFAAGVSFKTADIDDLEKISPSSDIIVQHLQLVKDAAGIDNVAVISTCNRVEIYGASADPLKKVQVVKQWMLEKSGGSLNDKNIYTLTGAESVTHLFKVTCGLDSMIPGETEIAGQVQDAIDNAVKAGTASGFMVRLFNHAQKASKTARTTTDIDKGSTSVAAAAVHMAGRIIGDLQGCPVLIAGAGKAGTLAGKHLAEKKAEITVVNRTLDKARHLAADLGAGFKSFDKLEMLAAEADVIICATSAPEPVITKKMIKKSVRQRRVLQHIIDISVPRNVEREVAELNGVVLTDMNDLQKIIEQNIAIRKSEEMAVENIIRDEVRLFYEKQKVIEAGPLIKELRDSFEQMRVDEFEKYRGRLDDNAALVVDQLTKGLTNRLLHWPTMAVRDFANSGGDRYFFELFEQVFGLDKTPAERKNKK